MTNLDLYRKAIRSGRVQFMSEVVVRLSTQDGCEYLVSSLLRMIDLKVDGQDETQERIKAIINE